MNLFGGGEPKSMTELRRLVTTFGFLVAKQGAIAFIGLAYWVITTHLFAASEVGIAAAAASTALLLVAIGALGIPLLLLAELDKPRLRSGESCSPPELRSPPSWSSYWRSAPWLLALPREESAHHRS